MPKVVHVLRKFEPAQWGGTETHVVGLLPELERLGWLSEVHAPAEAGTDGGPIQALGARFRTFRARYPVVGVTPAERATMVASGGNLVAVDELARLALDRRASLLHVHTQRRLGGVVRTAARLRGIPYAVTLHGPVRAGGSIPSPAFAGTPHRLDLGAAFGWLVGSRRVVEDADLVFVLNAAEETAWRKDRVGRHLERIPHGVATARATAAARSEARGSVPGLGNAPYVLVLGRLDPVKGQDTALAAFEQAAPPGLHLVLAGSATHADFARQIHDRAMRLGARVHVLGGVAPARARALLADAQLALVPSRAEAFGLVLLEAWAEATPVLLADVGGLADLSRAAGASWGRVAADAGAAGWAEALRAALSRPEALAAEGARGPERAAPYGWPAVAARIAAAYEHAIAAVASSRNVA